MIVYPPISNRFSISCVRIVISAIGTFLRAALTIELIAKLNPIPIICSKQSPQAGTTLNESLLAQVLAVEVQEVEGVEDDAMGPLSGSGKPKELTRNARQSDRGS